MKESPWIVWLIINSKLKRWQSTLSAFEITGDFDRLEKQSGNFISKRFLTLGPQEKSSR